MKKKTGTVKITRFELTVHQEECIREKLKGSIGWRELARRIGCSPQQAINLTSGVSVQWIREGILTFKRGNNGKH